MVKSINIRADPKLTEKMWKHKQKLELDTGNSMTWGDYFKLLFGMATGK